MAVYREMIVMSNCKYLFFRIFLKYRLIYVKCYFPPNNCPLCSFHVNLNWLMLLAIWKVLESGYVTNNKIESTKTDINPNCHRPAPNCGVDGQCGFAVQAFGNTYHLCLLYLFSIESFEQALECLDIRCMSPACGIAAMLPQLRE